MAVYPAHGVGVVQKIETKSFKDGKRESFYFLRILDTIAERTSVAGGSFASDAESAMAIRTAREAALADPEQKALEKSLGRPVTWLRPEKTR